MIKIKQKDRRCKGILRPAGCERGQQEKRKGRQGMREYFYDVILHTEIGKRKGRADVRIHGTRISGILTLLNKSEQFTGSIEQDGTCRLQGKLVSLLREIPFEAEGMVTMQQLELTLHAAQGSYRLTGVPADKRQLQMHSGGEAFEEQEQP